MTEATIIVLISISLVLVLIFMFMCHRLDKEDTWPPGSRKGYRVSEYAGRKSITVTCDYPAPAKGPRMPPALRAEDRTRVKLDSTAEGFGDDVDVSAQMLNDKHGHNKHDDIDGNTEYEYNMTYGTPGPIAVAASAPRTGELVMSPELPGGVKWISPVTNDLVPGLTIEADFPDDVKWAVPNGLVPGQLLTFAYVLDLKPVGVPYDTFGYYVSNYIYDISEPPPIYVFVKYISDDIIRLYSVELDELINYPVAAFRKVSQKEYTSYMKKINGT